MSRRASAILVALSLSAAASAGPPEPGYDRDVRPLLSDRCFACHGPDPGKRQGGLRLDRFEDATAPRHGGAAIVPGDADGSLLWQRVTSADPARRMPPPDANKRALDPAELALLRAWIEHGAEYEPHWSFVPPSRPALPAVQDEAWPATPIDRFVLRVLEQQGFAPAPEADPETLLRRLFLDLTGLPPTPEETDLWLSDPSPAAYERQVERLLHDEPYRTRYAEHWATPWLDAARYADTNGLHTDAGRQMWAWRDWVLRALRDNMPYDRFVIEQIAGDLIPGATLDQQVASGFHRAHVATDEGGAIPEEALVEYAVDRTATTGEVFLGLTLGCARCHDHKYDPITQRDFYGLYAFFNSIDEPGLYSQLPDPDRAFEPFLEVPAAEQVQVLADLSGELDKARTQLAAEDPAEQAARAEFFAGLERRHGLAWVEAAVAGAVSAEGAELVVEADGSVFAGGPNPARDEHVITLETTATGLRLLLLEALADARLPNGRVGRAYNGNAVLTGVVGEVISRDDPTRRTPVRFTWAFADHEQPNGDFNAVNVLETEDRLGWAVEGHNVPGDRALLLLADAPFGFAGGSTVVVRLQYRSIYDEHVLGRVRLRLGRLAEGAIESLPLAHGRWNLVGPFPADSPAAAYATAYGPEHERRLSRRDFGFGDQRWRVVEEYQDDRLNGGLPDGLNASYVARVVCAPSARRVPVALGSDDGFQLFVDGVQVAERQIDRSLARDQDRLEFELEAGVHLIVLKIVNTGGPGGFFFRAEPRPGEFLGDLALGLLPGSALDAARTQRRDRAWQRAFSPSYRESTARIEALEQRIADLRAALPRTMVMRELAMPRPTYVLDRGQYDRPDPARPVERGVPEVLGRWPEGAPKDRLGLARWLVAAENPLVARVAVNRIWQTLFGQGLVRTAEDFGMQGEWPSHPDLLDWLAVEFRESGWDMKALIRQIVTSRVYRQDSRVRPDVRERDPDNRWLAYFPRRRLPAEAVRDQALYAAGLLVERLGGPSVKPYQPAGLWQEVAMPASNTRVFVRGQGEDLWRRSLYTYWKRASPPPQLLAFDAPTREACTIRRSFTNTPLQALVLWNDEQFVEAARVLAQRTLAEVDGDCARVARMWRRCTGRTPAPEDVADVVAALTELRERFAEDPAAGLLALGEAPVPDGMDRGELAAWTLVASAILNLDATIARG